MFQTARGHSLKQVIEQLNPVLRGWVAYFRHTEVKGVLEELDGWIRHKLRAGLWRQWKRDYTRAKHLMRAGLSETRAWQSATNGRGLWWNGGASGLFVCFMNRRMRNRTSGGVGGWRGDPASYPIAAMNGGS